MQKGRGSRRCGKQHRAKEAANWAERAQVGRPRPVGPGRPTQPFLGPIGLPFDLIASQAINSPLTESHGEINLSSAAEEPRSLRDTIAEMRVVLVV
jgi:hypothetical protein